MILLLACLGVVALTVFNGYLGYRFGPVALPVGFTLGFLYGHFVLLAAM